MIFTKDKHQINTNLGGQSFDNLLNGNWKIGFFKDNSGIDKEDNTEYYESKTIKIGEEDQSHQCLKNKVNVTLYDNTTVHAHIIHWVKSEGWFCVTFDNFWDQFNT
jgi:hypothetical protein